MPFFVAIACTVCMALGLLGCWMLMLSFAWENMHGLGSFGLWVSGLAVKHTLNMLSSSSSGDSSAFAMPHVPSNHMRSSFAGGLACGARGQCATSKFVCEPSWLGLQSTLLLTLVQLSSFKTHGVRSGMLGMPPSLPPFGHLPLHRRMCRPLHTTRAAGGQAGPPQPPTLAVPRRFPRRWLRPVGVSSHRHFRFGVHRKRSTLRSPFCGIWPRCLTFPATSVTRSRGQ